MMVQTRILHDVVQRISRASFLIGGPVDEPRDAGCDDRSGTHRTRFDGDVQGDVVETPPPQLVGSALKHQDLGMSGWVTTQLPLVVSPRDNVVVARSNGTDWNITMNKCSTRFVEGELHEIEVSHGDSV